MSDPPVPLTRPVPEAADRARDRRLTTVAVLMTSHNRRQTTLSCLRALDQQTLPDGVSTPVFLTDDGSQDGTPQAVAQLAMDIRITLADGSLFWARGMARSERAAAQCSPDYFFWLNDDTLLDRDALARMLEVSQANPAAIIVGATRDPDTETVTYGGRIRTSTWHPQRFAQLPLKDEPQSADTFNGNAVLIPWRVWQQVGTIDEAFPHAYADDDYGLRARALGLQMLQASGSVGVCKRNPGQKVGRGPKAWFRAQDRKLLPWRAQVHYWRKHGGRLWPILLTAQQVRMIIPDTAFAPTRSRKGSRR